MRFCSASWNCSNCFWRIGSSTSCPGGIGVPGVNVSNTVSVDVSATWCAMRSATSDLNAAPFVSTAATAFMPTFCPGHTSGFLSGTKSVETKKPCSRSSMPSAAASWYVTEQRCPVILRPRLCASFTAAPSSARVMFMYALNDVAPASAQKLTMRCASAASLSSYICVMPSPGPCRYGAVASIHGPGLSPCAISFAMLISP